MNPQFDWRDMLRFDKMLSPIFLTIMYYVHVIVVSIFWLFVIAGGTTADFYREYTGVGGGAVVLYGLFMLVVSPFIIRLFYEILIVIFRIYSRLSSIDGKIGPQDIAPAPFSPGPDAFRQPVPQPVPSAPPGNPGYPPTQNMSYENSPPSSPPGFQVPFSTDNPVGEPTKSEPILQDFWQPGASPSGGTGGAVAPVDLEEIKSKMPNWPAVIAALVVFYGIVSPYAQIGMDVPFIGSIQAKGYAIKDSTVGMLAVLGSVAMLVSLGGGLKWKFFVGSYAATVLFSLVALFSNGSVFSDINQLKSGVAMATGGLGSSFGKFLPQGESISGQMANNMPNASQFLLFTFYLFLVGVLFLGYWAFAGKYREKGLISK